MERGILQKFGGINLQAPKIKATGYEWDHLNWSWFNFHIHFEYIASFLLTPSLFLSPTLLLAFIFVKVHTLIYKMSTHKMQRDNPRRGNLYLGYCSGFLILPVSGIVSLFNFMTVHDICLRPGTVLGPGRSAGKKQFRPERVYFTSTPLIP